MLSTTVGGKFRTFHKYKYSKNVTVATVKHIMNEKAHHSTTQLKCKLPHSWRPLERASLCFWHLPSFEVGGVNRIGSSLSYGLVTGRATSKEVVIFIRLYWFESQTGIWSRKFVSNWQIPNRCQVLWINLIYGCSILRALKIDINIFIYLKLTRPRKIPRRAQLWEADLYSFLPHHPRQESRRALRVAPASLDSSSSLEQEGSVVWSVSARETLTFQLCLETCLLNHRVLLLFHGGVGHGASKIRHVYRSRDDNLTKHSDKYISNFKTGHW